MFQQIGRGVAAAMVFAAACSAGQVGIDFTGSITAGTQDLSKFELLFYGTDGVNEVRGFQPLYNAGTSNRFCAAGQTCPVQATITAFLAPDTWSPTSAAYTIVGWYGAGPTIVNFNVTGNPSVFVLTKNGVDLSGTDFLSHFGIDENRFSTHMISWSDVFAYPDATTFITSHPSDMAALSLGGSASGGTIWDFTNGVQNGSASIQGAIQGAAVPEPSTVLLLLGGLGAVAFRRVRRAI